MLRMEKSRQALQNRGYPENKELGILGEDGRCSHRQAAGSVLGFEQRWEVRDGLCTCCSGAELPGSAPMDEGHHLAQGTSDAGQGNPAFLLPCPA